MEELIRALRDIIRILFTEFVPALRIALSHEVPEIANKIRQIANEIRRWGTPRIQMLWRCLLVLAAFMVGIPILGVLLDLLFKTGWITACVGVLLALGLMILLIKPINLALAALVGISWEIIHLRIRTTPETAVRFGKGYLDIVLGILLWELIIVFYLSIFPVWNNPRALPIVALCSLVICLMVYRWGLKGTFWRKAIYSFIVLVFLSGTLSLIFPKTTKALSKKMPALDDIMAAWVENPTWPAVAKKEVCAERRPLCGTIEVPAGEGLWKEAPMFIVRGEKFYLKSLEGMAVAVGWDDNQKKEFIIPQYGTLRRCTKDGRQWFVKRDRPTEVTYQIFP